MSTRMQPLRRPMSMQSLPPARRGPTASGVADASEQSGAGPQDAPPAPSAKKLGKMKAADSPSGAADASGSSGAQDETPSAKKLGKMKAEY